MSERCVSAGHADGGQRSYAKEFKWSQEAGKMQGSEFSLKYPEINTFCPTP